MRCASSTCSPVSPWYFRMPLNILTARDTCSPLSFSRDVGIGSYAYTFPDKGMRMLWTRISSTHIAIHQQVVEPDRCACALLLLFKYAGQPLANLLGCLHESFDLYLFVCWGPEGYSRITRAIPTWKWSCKLCRPSRRDREPSSACEVDRVHRNRSETPQTARSGVGAQLLQLQRQQRRR